MIYIGYVGNCHVGYGSLYFFQNEDIFHQFCHFGSGEIFYLWGNALNRTTQIKQAMGLLGSFAVLVILLSIFQMLNLMLVLVLLDLLFSSFFFFAKFFQLWIRCVYDKSVIE